MFTQNKSKIKFKALGFSYGSECSCLQANRRIIIRKFGLFFIVFGLLVGVLGFGGSVEAELINPATDLEYLGAFRLPSDTSGATYGWGYGLEAMTFYPDGDSDGPEDGYFGSIFASNHTHEKYIAEISIPVPISSKNLSDLNRATTLQNFSDINQGTYSTPNMEMEIEYLLKQGDQTSNKLYISWNSWYNVSDSDVDRYAWCDLDLSNPNTQGPWNLGSGDVNIGTVGEFLFEIPQSWADLHTPGKLLITGKYREGGCSGGGFRYGGGPGMHAYGPWNQGNPPSPGTAIEQITLLSYAGGHVWQCPANGDICKVRDKWEGGAWLTAGDKSAVVLTGVKGLGEDAYGDQLNGCGGKGFHSLGGYKPYMLFYDPDDLADVTEGIKEPYEPMPYATLDCGEYAFTSYDLCRAGYSSASYDREHNLLYVAEPFTDGSNAVIHVFRVTDSFDTIPPSRSNPSPTGELSSGTTQTTISLTTNETATCKYSTNPNTVYDSIPNIFSSTNSTTHSQTITGLSDGNTYTYYIRCQDTATPPNQNTDDFTISFSIATSTTYTISDFITLVSDWLTSGVGLESDVNNDGVVNTRDLGIMMSNWSE